ncbi:O-antigen ligase family protein [uncultured Pseudoxanthomonas sp.]|uniref:O-antigen ligase family protein n=1 Tax=uncultured Pseudoxanthomonas sp. TaxID=281701 RepID=UPI00260B8779|nr:O-antigen ligase family protein [uncultured Pseudoxanthomonas sp.]
MWMRLLLAVPLLFMPNMLHFSVDTGIPGLNLANIIFIVVLAALLMAGRRYAPLKQVGYLTPPLLTLFFALTLSFLVAQATLQRDFMEDFTYLKNLLFYPLLYFVYRRCGQDLKGTRQLIIFVMIVAALAGLEAIREGLDYGFGNYNESRRASGPFGVDYSTANRAGVFYAMFLPMFIAMALFFRKQNFWRLAAIGGCGIMVVAIMATYSRQSYLIALVAFALLLVRRNVVLAIAISVLMIPAISFLPESVTQRVAETEQQDAVGEEKLDVSTASRFEIWGGAMEMWSEHPLGVGLNRFKQYIGNYVPRYAGYDAHSIYFLMLAECGPLGLLALLFLLGRVLWMGIRFTRSVPASDAEGKALSLGFILLTVSTALGNVYGSPFFEGAVMANFWALCGLMEHYFALKSAPATTTAAFADAMPASAASSIGQRFPLAARLSPGKYRSK